MWTFTKSDKHECMVEWLNILCAVLDDRMLPLGFVCEKNGGYLRILYKLYTIGSYRKLDIEVYN